MTSKLSKETQEALSNALGRLFYWWKSRPETPLSVALYANGHCAAVRTDNEAEVSLSVHESMAGGEWSAFTRAAQETKAWDERQAGGEFVQAQPTSPTDKLQPNYQRTEGRAPGEPDWNEREVGYDWNGNTYATEHDPRTGRMRHFRNGVEFTAGDAIAEDSPRGARARAAQKAKARCPEPGCNRREGHGGQHTQERMAAKGAKSPWLTAYESMQREDFTEVDRAALGTQRERASAEWSAQVRAKVKALKPSITVCVQPELEEWE